MRGASGTVVQILLAPNAHRVLAHALLFLRAKLKKCWRAQALGVFVLKVVAPNAEIAGARVTFCALAPPVLAPNAHKALARAVLSAAASTGNVSCVLFVILDPYLIYSPL